MLKVCGGLAVMSCALLVACPKSGVEAQYVSTDPPLSADEWREAQCDESYVSCIHLQGWGIEHCLQRQEQCLRPPEEEPAAGLGVVEAAPEETETIEPEADALTTPQADGWDDTVYADSASDCVAHLRDARASLDEGDDQRADLYLQLANDPCATARGLLSFAIENQIFDEETHETRLGDYVAQQSARIEMATGLNDCTGAQAIFQEMVGVIPDVPPSVSEAYIDASIAATNCTP